MRIAEMIETPTKDGYYWVTNHEHPEAWDWFLVWLSVEQYEKPRVYRFCPEMGALDEPMSVTRFEEDAGESPHRWRDLDCGGSWSGPERWVGPIEVPHV